MNPKVIRVPPIEGMQSVTTCEEFVGREAFADEEILEEIFYESHFTPVALILCMTEGDNGNAPNLKTSTPPPD